MYATQQVFKESNYIYVNLRENKSYFVSYIQLKEWELALRLALDLGLWGLALSVLSQARSNMKFHQNQFTTVSKLDDGSDYDYYFKNPQLSTCHISSHEHHILSTSSCYPGHLHHHPMKK